MTTSRLAVYIGRFQPVHAGHIATMRAVLERGDWLLILLGSAQRSRSWKHPFTASERAGFIRRALGPLAARVRFAPLPDRLYDDTHWAKTVRARVAETAAELGNPTVVLTGFPKDRTSTYLEWFPEWAAEPGGLVCAADGYSINATEARRALFLGEGVLEDFGAQEMAAVQDWMKANPDTAAWIAEEARMVERQSQALTRGSVAWGHVIAVPRVEVAIFGARGVLMVRRSASPGKGLWSLPGTQMEDYERASQAVGRVLRDLGIESHEVIEQKRAVFDHPDRCDCGWVRSDVFAYTLLATPRINGSQWTWMPLDRLDPTLICDDHVEIIAGMATGLRVLRAA